MGMVKKIIAQEPPKVKIFIDMKDVNKLSRRTKDTDGAENNDSDDGDAITSGSECDDLLSEMEMDLARKRMEIEKRWRNECDDGFTYIFKDGTTLPLSIYMIKEWCRAWRKRPKGAVVPDIETPPNTDMFDPKKCHALHPSRRSTMMTPTSTPTPPPAGDNSNDLRDLTSVLMLQVVKDLMAAKGNPSESNPVPPSTPVASHTTGASQDRLRYLCKDSGEWLPVPRGYVVTEEGLDADDD
ncbi:hypothetical protein BJ138DRAFT_1120796 [Hygrophoropsis aurantiaca]|uniref:Uncharacterized protein n=1 Tax=Hygrophoropsis aurantiaca TaxID=72124 RepID=A0ACB7ZQK2_9AGAM|nr:hypothetical protein BJ138DRAFT_1120796 [Hygrophoropsis aurantiaca]